MNLIKLCKWSIIRFLPWYIFLILPFVYFYSENLAVLTLQLTAAFAAINYCLEALTSKENQVCSSTAAVIAVVLLVWFGLVGRSVVVSVDVSSSFQVLIKVLAMVLLFFTVSGTIKDNEFILQTDRAVIFTAFIHGLTGLMEYIEAPPIPKTWVDPALLEHVRTRCAGIFTDPNIFGAFLAVLFILTCSAILRTRTLKSRVFSIISLLLCGFAELTTLSRGSWIALSAGLICMVLFLRNNRIDKINKRWLFIAISLLIAIALIGPFKYRLISIASSQDMTIAQRSLINKGITRNFGRFLFTGFGLHTFNQIYPRFRIVGGDYPLYAHNEFIHSLIETGHLSALLLLLILLLIFLAARKSKISSMIVCSGFISSLTVMFVHNLSGFSSRILPTAVFIAFLSAGAAFQDKMREKLLYFHSAKYLRAFYIMILIVSVICVYQGIQTYRINDLIKQANEKFKLATACDNEMNYRHRIKQAVKILQKVLQLDPMNSLAHYKMSDACLVKGETELSKKHLKKAISLNSGEAIFYIRLANFYSNIEQNPKETENCYKKAIELDPACEIFRLEYAKLLISENRKNEAIEQLQKALEYSPGFHQVYTNYLKVEAMLKQLKNSQ